jgi:hypothetical protein
MLNQCFLGLNDGLILLHYETHPERRRIYLKNPDRIFSGFVSGQSSLWYFPNYEMKKEKRK